MPRHAVLQGISGGFRHSIFAHSAEEQLRRFIHHEALWRNGLSWPPRDSERYWSSDKEQQVRNRAIYHGLRLQSLHVINKLVWQVLTEAADVDALKAARRFAFGHREHIYRAGALSHRALQLTSTFPVLAIAIYSDRDLNFPWTDRAEWLTARAERKRLAAGLVERGVRLRDVAAVMDVPMTLRCLPPGAAHLVANVLCQRPQLLDLMPKTLPRARFWLRAVKFACKQVGPDFGEWTAREVPHIPGRPHEVAAFLMDIADWAWASTPLDRPEKGNLDSLVGRQFVTGAFTASMSLKTVTALSAAWHDAVASQMDGPEVAFPKPWYTAASVGDYEILPIESSAELYRESAAMHHCVRTYVDGVRCGHLYVYSIRRDNRRLATLALIRAANRVSLSQIRGPCNAQPIKEVVSIVRRWLRAQGPLPTNQARVSGDVDRTTPCL